MRERGLPTHHSCVFRWVQVYAPELDKRCRPYLGPTNKSYRVDKTFIIKVSGAYKHLYRAVDSTGQTIDFLLTPQRDATAAKCFFRQAFQAPGNPSRVVNVDKNAAYPTAIGELKQKGTLPKRVRLRQCRYSNNRVEQDHRFVKRRVRWATGYGSFRTARRTLQGMETMPMINKGRVRWLAKGDVIGQRKFVHKLFGIAA
jgi:IS6 family transposase